MASPSKTQDVTVLALQSVAADTIVVGSAIDLATKFAATVFIHFGRSVATALTRGVIIRVDASAKSSGDDQWFPLAVLQTAAAAAETEAVSGTVNAGQPVVTVASTTNLATRDIVLLLNGTLANSEWGRIASVVLNTSITLENNLTNAQTGATVIDSAELFVVQIDASAIARIRLVVDNSGTGQAVIVEAEAITLDSIA